MPAKDTTATTGTTGEGHPLFWPNHPKGVWYADYQPDFRTEQCGNSLNEPEGYMVETLRNWTMAQTDPALHRRLEAWQNATYYVNSFIDGDDGDVEAGKALTDGEDDPRWPVILDAVRQMAELIPLFDSDFLSRSTQEENGDV